MILLDSISKDLTSWINALKEELPADEVVTWDEVKDPSKVKVAVVWNHRKDLFQRLPNVELVASLGAGVDHIVNDPHLLKEIPVSKVISSHLTVPMSNYCIGAILHFHKQFDKYWEDKNQKRWHQEFDPEKPMKIGILGLGELGTDLAKKLVLLGFEVHGLSRTKKNLESVSTYGGNELNTFLSRINTLVCMLPATPKTEGIINQDLLNKLPKGSYLINVGRGKQQIDNDILKALENGRLKGAFLDVFPEEPLPKTSPLWTHPKIFITPHIAVVTKVEAAVPQIVENYHRLRNGEPLINLIDRDKGY
ncbi:MAG: glyoxylate/hydroxypyruvate reductase A [Ekhidna sp.]|nr:glyoxylate/hydroxypyruvate reductase A [Ekhidna sp.]